MMHLVRSLLIAPLLLGAAVTLAQPSPPPLRLGLTRFATGLVGPVDIAHAPGDALLYVVEKRGRIQKITPAGAVLPTVYLDIIPRVYSVGGEQGLLGLAFHPNYVTNGYFYVNYIANITAGGTTRISRFQRLAGSTDRADPASEVILYTVPQPFTNHNGGSMQFGPDGYLYIALGDGGSANDPGNRAQNLGSPFGKILRLDVDGGTPGGLNYGIPPTNPLVNTPGALPEIWAWGLRNPWRASFDSANGDYWIGDVGQGVWEEVDVMVDSVGANHNFGWRCYEGNHVAVGGATCAAPTAYHAPVFEYAHNNTNGGYSITGGYVYHGTQSPALEGHYVFADYVSGRLWTTKRQGNTYTTVRDSVLTRPGISSFGLDSAGELYTCELNAGIISRLTATGPVGLSAVSAVPKLLLSPNPATATCRIELPEAVGADIELISLVTGQTLRRTRSSATTAAATLDVRGLAAGIYGVRAYLPGRTLTQRLLVQKLVQGE